MGRFCTGWSGGGVVLVTSDSHRLKGTCCLFVEKSGIRGAKIGEPNGPLTITKVR